MTKLTNEEEKQRRLAQFERAEVVALDLVGDRQRGKHRISYYATKLRNFAEAEILQRMAEGAAGEASPQNYLVEAWKGLLACTERRGDAAKMLAVGKALIAIEKFESGSASTAGPRPRCPKCGSSKLQLDWDAGQGFNVQCLERGYDNFEHFWDELEMSDFAQFFAAAPAESTKVWIRQESCSECDGDGCAKCAPEDVQLDVEAEKRIAEIRKRLSKVAEGPWFTSSDDASDSPDHKDSGLAMVDTGRSSEWPIARLCEWQNARFIEHAILDIPFLLEQLALLRRVSGKGAQRCPTCQKTIWHPGLQWSMPVPYYCGCPAPVPATPDVRRIQEIASDLAQELLDETRTRHNLEHGCWPGLVHIADKIEKAIKLATTQGTPEGAKVHCQECREVITFNGQQWLHADGTPTYPRCTRTAAASQKGEEGK